MTIKMSIKNKIIASLVITSLMATLIVSFYMYYTASSNLKSSLESQFSIIRDRKVFEVKNFFEKVFGDIKTVSTLKEIQDGSVAFESIAYGMGLDLDTDVNLTTTYYSNVEKDYLEKVKNILDLYQFDNLIIILNSGNIISQTKKNELLGTNVKNGKSKDSALASCYREAIDPKNKNGKFIDLHYSSIHGHNVAYYCYPITSTFERDGYAYGERLSVVAIEVNWKTLNTIISSRENLGQTGEVYIVGNDNHLRTNTLNSNYQEANTFNNNIKLKSEVINKLFAKTELISGVETSYNYDKEKVLSAYSSFNIFDAKWGLITEMRENEAFSMISNMRYVASIFVIILISIITGLGWFIGASMGKPIFAAAYGLQNITKRATKRAIQVSKASQELASRSNEQASSVEETSSSLEEISGMIENNLSNAREALELSENVEKEAKKGNESMNSLQMAMKEILNSNEKIEKLVKVIEDIKEKTQIMDEIVFQTKLLSFNASVEAERAGEYGRGFAVVAQEVGNLAQMSGKAAQEIAVIVTESIKDAQAITIENKEKVEYGNKLVSETADILKNIMKSSQTVTSGSNSVLSASKDQSEGIKQINQAIAEIDKATQENASISQDTSEASQGLMQQIDELKAVVADLTRLATGDTDGSSELNSTNAVEDQKTDVNNFVDIKEHISKKTIPLIEKKAVVGGDLTIASSNADDSWEKL